VVRSLSLLPKPGCAAEGKPIGEFAGRIDGIVAGCVPGTGAAVADEATNKATESRALISAFGFACIDSPMWFRKAP
jgi:hypothetical protein